MIRRALAPLAMVLLMALPITAGAAPKIAVTAIDGDSESEIRDALLEAIEGDEYKLASKKETNRAFDKIGDASDLTEKSAKKLAKDLLADAIISGSLENEGAKKTLKIKLFVNGKAKKGFSVKFKGSASAPKFKKAVRKKLLEKLDGVTEMAAAEEAPKKPKKAKKPKKVVAEADDEEPEDSGEEEDGEDEEEAPRAKATPATDDEEIGKRASKKTAALDDDDDGASITGRAQPRSSSGRSANRAAVRVDVGPSMVKRTLIFNSNLPSDQRPKPFRPSPVIGARVEGELYPLGFVTDGILSGIGLGFRYDRTAKMTTGTAAEPNVDIPTKQFNYAAGVRIRLVGKRPTSPSVTLIADVGRSRFQPDRDRLMDPRNLDVLPDTYYKFIAPGLGFRIPIGGTIAFTARGEALLISDAGAIVRSYSYGKAKVLGFDTEAGLDVVLAKRYAVRLSGGFTQVGYEFQGEGGKLANSLDGDPTTRDVGGAADRLITAALTFAAMY